LQLHSVHNTINVWKSKIDYNLIVRHSESFFCGELLHFGWHLAGVAEAIISVQQGSFVLVSRPDRNGAKSAAKDFLKSPA
jgi:hypothetical protein